MYISSHFLSLVFSPRIELVRFTWLYTSVLSKSPITSDSIIGARHTDLALVEGASIWVGVAGACLLIALWFLHHRSVSTSHQGKQTATSNRSNLAHRENVDLGRGTMDGIARLPRWMQHDAISVSRPDVSIRTAGGGGTADLIASLPRRGGKRLQRALDKALDFRPDLIAGNLLNASLHRLGYEKTARPFSDFIAFRETQNAARAQGISVGELIERKHLVGSKTALQQTMEGMASFGVFDGNVYRVCEIGPGSGRYLEQIFKFCKPKEYEIYETSPEWRDWLAKEFPVVARKCDGVGLSETETASVDLVQAHKVFPGLPLLTTLSYFREMSRVVREDGWIVFDVMTEQCFEAKRLQAWFDVNPWNWDWSPRMCAVQYVLDMFAQQGIRFIGSFQVPLYPGVTECLVLRKTPSIH
jgi:hypothetical protein